MIQSADEEENKLNSMTAPPIRVVIAEDHLPTLESIRCLLAIEPDIEVVGGTGDGCEVIELIANLDPDVVLLDMRMQNLDWPRTLQRLNDANRRLRIVMLADVVNRDEFEQAMKLGCSGFFLNENPLQPVAKCIRKVFAGEIWLEEQMLVKVVRQSASPAGANPPKAPEDSEGPRDRSILTDRERQIVTLVAQGLKNQEIAEQMSLSISTVAKCVSRVFQKLDLSNRLQLAQYALEKGWQLID